MNKSHDFEINSQNNSSLEVNIGNKFDNHSQDSKRSQYHCVSDSCTRFTPNYQNTKTSVNNTFNFNAASVSQIINSTLFYVNTSTT